MFFLATCIALTAFAATNELEALRKDFRTRCATLVTESFRSGSGDALVTKIQMIAREVFSDHPDALRTTNEKWFCGLPFATQQEVEFFKSEWALPTNALGKTHGVLSHVPLPAEAARYYLQGINPAEVIYPILEIARYMTGVPPEVMIVQVYVPPEVKIILTADDSQKILIRTLWCEVHATLEMTQAGVFVPTAIDGRKIVQTQPSEGTR